MPLPDEWYLENWPGLNLPAGKESIYEAFRKIGMSPVDANSRADHLHRLAIQERLKVSTARLGAESDIFRQFHAVNDYGQIQVQGVGSEEEYEAMAGPVLKGRREAQAMQQAMEGTMFDNPVGKVLLGGTHGIMEAGRSVLASPFDIVQGLVGWTGLEFPEEIAKAIREDIPGGAFEGLRQAANQSGWSGELGYTAAQLYAFTRIAGAIRMGLGPVAGTIPRAGGMAGALGLSGLEMGGAGLLLTPGSLGERGTGALVGAAGGVLGSGLQMAATRFITPRLVAPLAAVIEKRGIPPTEAAAIAGSILPHVTGVFTGAAGFTLAETPFLPDDMDVNLTSRFIYNLTSLGTLGSIYPIFGGLKGYRGMQALKEHLVGEPLTPLQEAGLPLHRRALLVGRLSEKLTTEAAEVSVKPAEMVTQLAGPNALTTKERQALKAATASVITPDMPAVWVHAAAALARRGIPLNIAQAREIVSGDARRVHDIVARLLGSDLTRNADELVREMTVAEANKRVRIDDDVMMGEAAAELVAGEAFPRDLEADILAGGLLGTPAYQAADHNRRRLLTRFVHLLEQEKALRQKLGMDQAEVEAKWSASLVDDLEFLQTYALHLEGTGVIAPPMVSAGGPTPPQTPMVARETKARDFLARLPRPPGTAVDMGYLQGITGAGVTRLSELVAAMRIVTQGRTGGISGASTAGYVARYVRAIESNPEAVRRTKALYPAIERAAQQAAQARKLPEFVLVFRTGGINPNLEVINVALDPRTAIAHSNRGADYTLHNLYKGSNLVETVGGTKRFNGETPKDFGVYLVPRAAIRADLDTLMGPYGSIEPIGELHVDTRALVPITEIQMPVIRPDLASALKIFPPLQRDLQTLAQTRAATERTAGIIARSGQPVAWIGKSPVLALTFLPNPDPSEGQPMVSAAVTPTKLKGGMKALEAVRKAMSEGTDPKAALMEVFRDKLYRMVKKDVNQQAKVLSWALEMQRWYEMPEATRLTSRPPVPPEGVANPLGVVAQLRGVFGNALDGARRASLNIVGKGSAGQALLQHPDALEAATAALEAYRTNTWIDPIDHMGRTPHTKSQLSDLDLGGPPMPNLAGAARSVVEAAIRIRNLLPGEAQGDADVMLTQALEPLSGAFIRHPGPFERAGLVQASQSLLRTLTKWTDDSQTGRDPRLGIEASSSLLDAVDKFQSMVSGTKRFLLHHETKWRMFIEHSTQGMTPEEAQKFEEASQDRIYQLGEKDPQAGVSYHPAELETVGALKQVYESFAEAMEISGWKPIKDGSYMSRIYKRLSEMAEHSGDKEQALSFQRASSKFLKARTRAEAGPGVETDMFEVMRQYVPSMSRAMTFGPVAKAFEEIVKTHGVKAPETTSTRFHFGFGVPKEFKRDPKGIDWRTVKMLQKVTNRMAGVSSPLDATFERGLGYVAKAAFGWNLGKLWDWQEKSPRMVGKEFGQHMANFTHFLALAGVVPTQLIRNVMGGGLIASTDGGYGLKALTRGIGSYLQVDVATGTVRPDPVVNEILGDDTFVRQLTRNIEANWETAVGTGKGGWLGEATRFLATKATVPFGMSEVMVRGAVAKGAYLLGLESGLSHGDAVRYARQITARTQTQYDAITGASLFGSSAGRFFGQFQRFGWNWLDQLSQRTQATGLFGKARAATALVSLGGPEVIASGYKGNIPSFRKGQAVQHALSPVAQLAFTVAAFAMANLATRHLFGVVLPDHAGVLASAPDPVRLVAGTAVRQIVENLGPGTVPEKTERAKAVADALGVDVPPGGLFALAGSAVGPAPGMMLTPLDMLLRWDGLSPRETAEVMDGWSLITQPSQVRAILKSANALREGHFKSRSGNRIGPEGRDLGPAERLKVLFGFTPASVKESLDNYTVARDIRDWYDDAMAWAGDKAKDALRKGKPEDAVAGWLADQALIQEELGVYRPWKGPTGLQPIWNRLVKEARESGDLSLGERARSSFPLDRIESGR